MRSIVKALKKGLILITKTAGSLPLIEVFIKSFSVKPGDVSYRGY
jgi:hypothetical protein